ncbi:MAG: YihY/virulence factor BrkB family protein [Chthoniobacteraceae bacterium]
MRLQSFRSRVVGLGQHIGSLIWSGALEGARRFWAIIVTTVNRYVETDGELRAASFGYYAFFALFPLLLLFVYVGTMILGNKEEVARQVLYFVGQYIPTNPNERDIVAETVHGALNARGQAGFVALLALAWSALRFFQALVHGVNRAWGTQEYSWWRLPIANFGMVLILAATLGLGVLAPVLMTAIEAYWRAHAVAGFEVLVYSFSITRLTLPIAVLFYGLLMFYKYAPRRRTYVREVWLGAFLATLFLQILQKVFVIYWSNFAHFNFIYGTLASVIAVLMWIYLAGSIIIFGGCWCAAQYEVLNGRRAEVDSKP